MLMHIDDTNRLTEEVKSIKHLCNEVAVYKSMRSTEFVEELLASGYSDITS